MNEDDEIVHQRAIRRNQRINKRNKAERIVRDIWQDRSPALIEQMMCNCDNLKLCGKDCCKNPRRSGWSKASGRTRRELRDDIKEQDVE